MPLIANNHTPRSSWVGRTRFSRSICYGSNSSFLSSTAGLLLEDSNPEEFVKVVHEDHGLSLNSRESMTDGMIPSSRKTVPHNRTIGSSLSFGNSKPLLYASNCIDASSEKNRKRQYGQHRRSMSLPSKRVDANAVDDEKTNCSTGRSYATNTTSWSEYIVCSGNGFAVEEAENWMIDLSNLFLGNKFAFGAFSRLYIGKYKESPVAVKVLRKSDENEKISVRIDRQFKTEVNVLSKVEHRNVVKFYGAFSKPPVSCIVMEYLPLGSVRSYLHNQQFPLSLKTVISMAVDVARGMEYLHSQGVIHRDLKSENLVISEDLCVKIIDFGVACFESENSPVTEDVGTYRWMAPEMFSKRCFSKKVDVYSFGIILWELLTGHVPFEEYTPVQAAFAKVHKQSRPPLPINCPSVLAHLMQQCWHGDPAKRPSFTKIVGVLEEMQGNILQNRSSARFHRPFNPVNGLLHCFGRGLSHHVL